eukprot:g15600.t1
MPAEPMLILIALAAAAAGAGLVLLIRRPPRDDAGAREEAEALRDQLHQEQLAHGEARTRLEGAAQQLAEARERGAALERRIAEQDAELARRQEAIARAEQRLADQQEAQQDYEKLRAEYQAMAKSSVSQIASEVSNKLLADHKRENEEAKKQAEERVAKATAELLERVQKMGEQFQRVDELSRDNRATVDRVLRALSAPNTAGHAAQTTLGNVLKAFGLTEGRDFVLEYTVSGGGEAGDGRLRPDAVVFLPSDTVLVIDSKSSKHLLELAEAEEQGEEAVEAARERFKKSMRQHLRDLTTKDYRAAVAAALRAADRPAEARQVLTLMWLPNEGAVEKLAHADPHFTGKAAEAQIYVSGPSGLWSAVGIAGTRIRFATQQDNLEKLAHEAGDLVERVSVMLEHAGKVGALIGRALESYDRMAGSANARVRPRMVNMEKLGLAPPAKGLPEPLPRFTVQRDAISVEAEPIERSDAPAPAAPQLFPPDRED